LFFDKHRKPQVCDFDCKGVNQTFLRLRLIVLVALTTGMRILMHPLVHYCVMKAFSGGL
jgi:hypothetical protein